MVLKTRKLKKKPQVFSIKPGTGIISKVNWETFDRILPSDRSAESRKMRSELFNAWDPNRNGHLSCAELDRGLMITFNYDPKVRAAISPSIKRAYRGAKTAVQKNGKLANDDYVEKREFRVFVEFLRYDLHILVLFGQLDTSEDHRISHAEFQAFFKTHKIPGLPEMSYDDLEKEFSVIDANGGGMILFDEFASYMIEKRVDHPAPSVVKMAARAGIHAPKATFASREEGKSNNKFIYKQMLPTHSQMKTHSFHSPQITKTRKSSKHVPRRPSTSHSTTRSQVVPMFDQKEYLDVKFEELQRQILAQVQQNHNEVMQTQNQIAQKIEVLSKALASSNMLGAPTMQQKVQALIGQVSTLSHAIQDISLQLDTTSTTPATNKSQEAEHDDEHHESYEEY